MRDAGQKEGGTKASLQGRVCCGGQMSQQRRQQRRGALAGQVTSVNFLCLRWSSKVQLPFV